MIGHGSIIRKLSARPWAWVLFLFGLGIVIEFAPCWTAPTLIAQDDSILRLPVLSNWRNLPIIFSQQFMPLSAGMYHPGSYALVAVLRTIFPVHVAWLWHTMLIGLHLLNVWMVFLLTRQFARHTGAAAFAAAVFCFHPLAAVFANDIGNLFMLLGGAFYLCALLCYLSYRRHGHRRSYLLSVMAFVAGLLTARLVVTLPLFLAVYELLYERNRLKDAGRRLRLFVILVPAAILLWRFTHPHPLLFSYASAQAGEWPSFYSIVAGSKYYVRGILLGSEIPIVLHDAVRKVFTPKDVLFIGWSAIHLMVILVAAGRALRKDVIGLGFLLMYIGVLPFLTTAWNPVNDDYVSWKYLYVSLVGLAVAVGALADKALGEKGDRHLLCEAPAGPSRQKVPVPFFPGLIALLLLLGLYGVRLFLINYSVHSPVRYWSRVTRMDPMSETAHTALGKAYLAKGDVHNALEHLFTPWTTTLEDPCRVMCRYYVEHGDLFAASIHAGFMQNRLAAAMLFEALGAVDYAESSLGHATANNPLDAEAMRGLARVFAKKGFLPDARRWAERALEIDPSDEQARRLLGALRDDAVEEAGPYHAKPPAADWLRMMASGRSTRRVRNEIIQRSEDYPDDPIVQMRAGYCLIENGDLPATMAKFEGVYGRLSSYAPLKSLVGWALASSHNPASALDAKEPPPAADNAPNKISAGAAKELYDKGVGFANRGEMDEAIGQFLASLEYNPRDARTHYMLGLCFARKKMLSDAIWHYTEALRLNPDSTEAHTNLGNVLSAQGKLDEAIGHFTRSLQIKPDDPNTHYNLAVAYYEKGDYAAAWGHVHQCRRLGKTVRPDFLKALSAKMQEPKGNGE